MDQEYFKKIATVSIIFVLFTLTFFILKPILLAIIFGIILSVVFAPVYSKLLKIIRFKNLTALLICIVLVLLIVLPVWFLTPIFINQSFKIYLSSQQLDYVTPLKKIFPSFFASEQFSNEIGSIMHSFVTKTANSLTNSFSEIILNFPKLVIQLLIVISTFFFVLRDKEELLEYIKSILPFPKEVEDKLFKSSKEITFSVIYGQVVVGILQGIIAGIGFFLFDVPNALLLTFISSIAGIIPLIGPIFVWVPVIFYLLISDAAGVTILGVLVFGTLSSTIDNILRPLIVSKRTRVHSGLVIIGMVGGYLLFGIMGFILGPLILAYLLIVLESYRKRGSPEVFIKTPG